MLKGGQRFGDVCEENIPKGTKYQRNRLLAHAAHLVAASRADLTPTWTTNQDGTISLDICTTPSYRRTSAPVTSSVSSANSCCWRREALRLRLLARHRSVIAPQSGRTKDSPCYAPGLAAQATPPSPTHAKDFRFSAAGQLRTTTGEFGGMGPNHGCRDHDQIRPAPFRT